MFSETLQNLRNSKNWSQAHLSHLLGMSRVTYSKLESGITSPSLEIIFQLSAIFEVNPEIFIYGRESELMDTNELDSEGSLADLNEEIIPRDIPKENIEKFREVLLYVLDQVAGKSTFGETVLYKLLYFIDFDFYEKTGKSITGMTYVRNHYGPTPKIKTFSSVVNQMKKRKELDVVETEGFNGMQRKYLPRISPRLDQLNAAELDHINDVLARLGDKNASELTAYSHRDTPWIATKHLKPIEYQLAKYRTSETSVKELEDDL